jgi:hypothetical protein
MRNIGIWSSEAVTGHQEVDFVELPSWENLRHRLLTIGHFTSLSEPSLDHQAGAIAKPIFTVLTRYMFPV